MNLSPNEKENIKKKIVEKLGHRKEIDKIIIFGSFVNSENPKDIDLAIFQNSDETYLSLSLKYRKAIREISKSIPVDVFPIISQRSNDFVLNEIESGEVIYERGN